MRGNDPYYKSMDTSRKEGVRDGSSILAISITYFFKKNDLEQIAIR